MRLTDFYKDWAADTEKQFRETYGALISRLEDYERAHPNVEFEIRNTDHHYSPIRISSRRDGVWNDEDIDLALANTCFSCGSLYKVNFTPDDEIGFHRPYCCDACALKRLRGIDYFIGAMKYLFAPSSDAEDEMSRQHKLKIAKEKVRLKTSTGQIIYKRLGELGLTPDGKVYINHSSGDMSDVVEYAGLYTHKRDVEGNRIYIGDIVSFVVNNTLCNNELFYGVVVANTAFDGEMYMETPSSLYGNFPPQPSDIVSDTIKVLGNVFENPEQPVYDTPASAFWQVVLRQSR